MLITTARLELCGTKEVLLLPLPNYLMVLMV